ncbi:PD-(D/E)XK nuclease family protein [candidate division KSB1 bacterium]|nr:PD-(D/E)XK nuclease family protein [candidate division KSB1 bacterium]
MPRVKIYSGSSWAAFTDNCHAWLPDSEQTCCILAPSHMKSERIQALFDGHVCMTTKELLERYVSAKTGQQQLLSKQAVEQLLLSIIFEKSDQQKKGATRYLNIETYHQGYARALTEFILDFRENGQINLLETLNAFKKQALSAKERDLINIHDELENLLSTENIFDFRRAVFDFVDDHKAGNPAVFLPEYAESPLIVFGFSYLSMLESKLLGYLMYRFKQSVFLQCRNDKAAESVSKCQITVSDFLDKARSVFKDEIEYFQLDNTSTNPQMELLSELIFQDDKKQLLNPKEVSIRLMQSNDRFAEIITLARIIRQLNDSGMSFDQIRLIFPQQAYISLVHEVFPRYQIPFTLASGTPMTFYPLAQLIKNMVIQAVDMNPYATREKIFSSSYITFSCQATDDQIRKFLEKINPTIYDEISHLLTGNRSVKLNYNKLHSLQKKAGAVIRSTEKLHPLNLALIYFSLKFAHDDQVRRRRSLEIILDYYVLSQAERALYVFRGEMRASAFSKAIDKLIDQFQIKQCIDNTAQSSDADIRALVECEQAVLAGIRRICDRLELQYAALSREADGKFPLSDMALTFTRLMSDPENGIAHTDAAGITILNSVAPPLTSCPVTILGGLVDGDFPAQDPFNFLQPKSEGQYLSDALSNVDRDRHALYQLIASTPDTLIMSYPMSDGGKRLLTSPFIAEVRKCFDGIDIIQSDTANTQRYSNREKIEFIARNVDANLNSVKPVVHEFPNEFISRLSQIFTCDGLRSRIDQFSKCDGLLQSEIVQAAIKKHVHEFVAITIENLERYAGCPMRFLFDDMMSLKPEYITDYHPDTTERGKLMQHILTEFSSAMVDAGEINDESYTVLKDIASVAVDGMLHEKDDLFNHRFKGSLLAGLEQTQARGKRPGYLAAFLRFEQTKPDMLNPFLAKIESGINITTNQDQVISLKLTIDRVDRTKDGKYLILYNYSIADLGDVEGIGKGLKFKLPLQILALRDYVSHNQVQGEAVGAGTYLVKTYRNIKRGGYFALQDLQATRKEKVSDETPIYSAQRKFGFLPYANLQQELNQAQDRVNHIHNLIQRGRFHLTVSAMKDQICPNCHFWRICRKEQLRLDKLYSQIDKKDHYVPLRRLVE